MYALKGSLLVLVSTLFFSCSGGGKKDVSKGTPPALVDVIIASTDQFQSSLEVNGSVLAAESVELHPEVSGRLVFLQIPDGATVKEGTLLATVNNADIQAQLEQQKALLKLAADNEHRLRQLLSTNGINQADYDAVLTQVSSSEAAVKVLQAQMDKTMIRAPFTGELGLRMVSPGAYVTPQTIVTTLQQSDKVKIDFTMQESNLDHVSKGSVVTVEIGSGKKFSARVIAVEPQINTDTRNFKVRAVLENGFITPGSFVKVSIAQHVKAIMVPSNAIIPDALSNKLVLVKEGKAKFVNVETGDRNEDVVSVLSGIDEGDSIVVSGVLFVRPNGDVKIRKVKSLK